MHISRNAKMHAERVLDVIPAGYGEGYQPRMPIAAPRSYRSAMAAAITTRAAHVLRLLGLLVTGLTLAVLLIGGAGAAARADTGTSGGDMTVAQTLDGDEVTVVLRRITSVPGPLQVEVITHTGGTLRSIDISAVQDGPLTGTATVPRPISRARIVLPRIPAAAAAALQVDRPGAWLLRLASDGTTATIPFIVPAAVTAPQEQAVYIGFVGAGICLVLALVVAARARSGWWTIVPVGGLVTGVAVAVTAAMLSATTPLPPAAGTTLDPTAQNITDPYANTGPRISDYSRPAAQLTVDATPRRGIGRAAGAGTRLVLQLLDSATGIPVDDLVDHDDAFIHLLVVGPDGVLRHVHPVRIRSGVWLVDLPATLPGHYAVSAEFERRGGGTELARSMSGFDVAGRAAPAATAAAVLRSSIRSASVQIGASRWHIAATGLVAGAATTITATAPAPDLQLWLGMVGHAIIAGPLSAGPITGTTVQAADTWSHTHSMGAMTPGSMSTTAGGMAGMAGTGAAGSGDMGAMAPVNGDSAPDETVAHYGPAVPFTYTFATAGRFRVWIQVEEGYRITTTPLDVSITAGVS
jgi:hypothetical protein